MQAGESLKDVIRDIVSQRKFNLRFDKERREEHNRKVKDFEKILPMGDWLRAFPFYDYRNPEIGTLIAGIGATIFPSLLGHLVLGTENSSIEDMLIPYGISVGSFVGAAYGILMGGINRSFRKGITKDYKKEIDCINKSLGYQTQSQEGGN